MTAILGLVKFPTPKSMCLCEQWRSRGEASGSTRPGAQALAAHQYTFCSHLKTRFKQKF